MVNETKSSRSADRSDPHAAGQVSRRSRQAIIDALAEGGAATRMHLVDRTALSRATIAAAVNELLADGTLTQMRGGGAAARGRQPARLDLSPLRGMLCAIDLGHHHVAVAVGPHVREIAAQEWMFAEVDRDPAEALSAATAVASRLLSRVGEGRPLAAIAVVVPQPVTDAGGSLVATPFLPNWHGLDVPGRIRAEFGVPTVIENDANAAAIAEAGADAKTTAFVKVSTGLGAGIVLNGELVRGYGGQAGEIGHLVVKADGQLCGCGNRGCLETLASVPAILRALEPVHGRLIESDLNSLLASGDTASARAMRDAGGAIGTALAPVVAALQLEDIVVGGPREIPMEHLVTGVRTRVESLVHPQVLQHLSIRTATRGPFAPLMGAMQIAERIARARVRHAPQ
jgi:predicted NBD/HSP70 family sugar kinase